jgi:transposase
MDLTPHRDTLRHLTRTDPDPRVRHRADALLLVASGLSVSQAASQLGACPTSLRRWRARFFAHGRDGLADRPRRGRPPKLDDAACELLETALDRSPLDEGYPVTTWTVVDLRDLLARRGYDVSVATVYRTLERLGYRYRRPRHDLSHRQDADAVASAKHVLAELQKRGLVPDLDSGLSMWMNATSTLIPTWQRSGPDAGNP